MGATNCPETPRQRLISMMYLVLTALLALNVSKDILNAFSIVDETLQTSNQITESKNFQDYIELNRQKGILGEEKVAKEFERAMQLKELSNEIVEHIEKLKIEFIEYVDGESPFTSDGTVKSVFQLNRKDNISKATAFMTDGHAKELKSKIEKYRTQLLSFVDEKDIDAMSETIGLDVNEKFKNANGAPESWETHYFEGVIFAAGVTLLNKLVGEVRNAESGVLKYIIRSITKDDFNFSNVSAKVIPKSQLVFLGEGYEADIIVAAYDDKQPIEAYWRSGTGELTSTQGAAFIRGEEGVAKLKIGTGSVGDFSFTGFIRMVGPDGKPQTHHFSDKYMVMAPSATAAAEKMNVLYAGLENPISVSASVSAEKVSISLSDGSQTKIGPGKYNVTVPESAVGKTVTITIIADVGGKQQTMGSNTFRVKRVPDPVAMLSGKFKGGGKAAKADLTINPFVSASLGDDFVYDLRWAVNSFNVTFVEKGIESAPISCTGNQFSETVKSKINSSPAGTVIYFSEIRVSCVAGNRTLNPLAVILR
jgi:gliding motility-associated protein GldM